MLKIIKTSLDGCTTYQYKNVEFSTNPQGMILWSSDWNVVVELVKNGLAKREFYQYLYGHIAYFIL